MSISALNRPSSPALSRTSHLEPLAPRARGVESTPALPPSLSLRQQLMTDSFEQGPRRLGDALGSSKAVGASGGAVQAMEQISRVLGELVQLLKGVDAPMQASQGGVQGAPAAASAPSNPGNTPHPTYDNGAGPGFGAPSAGSTQPAPADQPWLSLNNVGSPYNSNMQLIDPGQKSQYKYTNTFTNNTGQPQTITLWNKTGQNGNPNDGQHFDKSTPKTFTLQPGQSQVVAFDTNSSVAWSVSKDGTANPGANFGQTWGEATFGNSTTGWSGYDVSQISPAGHNGNMSIRNDATGHTVTEANAWQTPSDDPAGRDVGVPAGPLHLTTSLS